MSFYNRNVNYVKEHFGNFDKWLEVYRTSSYVIDSSDIAINVFHIHIIDK